jgi:hypothetical protein
MRNQDIGVGLANQLINLRTQPIYIRTPFTCKSISRICQLCYGQSTTHNRLIELGEAIGIIAGQSIGEPGTQLKLRTFHTGGVFTGDIAEHVRAPFNGKIEFNDNLVYPTHTCNVHPILRMGYLWILSGGIYGSGVVPFPFHKHQDQVDVQPFVSKHQSLSDSYVDQVEHRSGDSNCYGKEEQIFSYSETDRTISNKHQDSIYVTLSPKNYNMKGKRQMN